MYTNKFNKFGLNKYKYGDIRFLQKLGEGSTGSVYKCKINGIYYAIKIFDIYNYLGVDGLIDDVYNELYISSLLKSTEYSNLIKGYCIYNRLDDVKIYLISDYYKKSLDLRDFISKKYNKKSEYVLLNQNKISIITQLILGLKEINENKVLHCDIKLENIIIYKKDNEYKIKFIDFGGSCYLNNKIVYDSSDYDYNFGTTGYMSKEVYNNNIYISSDIYALFVCILEILVGKIWGNDDSYKKCRKEIKIATNKLNNLEIKKYINLCLSEDYKMRPNITDIETKFIILLRQLDED